MAKKSNNGLLVLGALAAGAIYMATKDNTPKVGAIGERVPYVPNFHVIRVSYLGPTNNKDARVKLTSDRFKVSKTIPYDYDLNSHYEVAIKWLLQKGFNVVGKGEGGEYDYIITDTFEPLS